MPEYRKPAPPGPLDALAAELRSGRSLLEALSRTEAAMRAGRTGQDLLECVRAQDEAAREASAAAAARRMWFSGPDAFEALLRQQTPEDAAALRRLAAEAAPVRAGIARAAGRSRYIAQKNVEWTQAQMEVVVDLVTRQDATYGEQGRQRKAQVGAAAMDRSA